MLLPEIGHSGQVRLRSSRVLIIGSFVNIVSKNQLLNKLYVLLYVSVRGRWIGIDLCYVSRGLWHCYRCSRF